MRYLLLVLTTFPAFGIDQIAMKNGDRISGSIVKFDGKAITVKSDYAGDLVIKWEAVAGLTSAQPLNVGFKDGQVLVGTVTTKDDTLSVQTANTGTVPAPLGSITYIRSNEEEAAYEAEEARYRNPRIIDLWTGTVGLGYAKAAGNSRTTNLNVAANAVRETRRDKTTVYFTTLYATSLANGISSTTANAQRGGFSYQLNLTPKFYVFGGSDFEADQSINTDRATLDVYGGGALDKEYYSTNVNKKLRRSSSRRRISL